jgi:glycosyltransferase involved in cell wall biosynthesis
VTGTIELLYAGRFYQFRGPDELLAAIARTEGVRLSIASVDVPQVVLDHAEKYPTKIRLLGFLPHEEVLAAQQRADVLVNIGNEDPTQIPGKFFEYLGAGKPILHLSQTPDGDEVAGIIVDTGRGWVVENRRDDIAQRLNAMVRTPLRLDPAQDDKVKEYAWERIAIRLEELLISTVARRA